MRKLKQNLREPLEKLKTYPAFQALRAKAERHQDQFRPKEQERLKKAGTLNQVLDERTESAWNILADQRRNGANLNEAEELAYPSIYLPSEKEEQDQQAEEKEP